MFGCHHVHHNVPLGSKFIEDSDLCGQMIFWWNCWIKSGASSSVNGRSWRRSGDRYWNKVYIHKRQLFFLSSYGRVLWTCHCWQRCYWHLCFFFTCLQIPSKSYTTGWIGLCLVWSQSWPHQESAAKVVLSTVESTPGILVHNELCSPINPLESPLEAPMINLGGLRSPRNRWKLLQIEIWKLQCHCRISCSGMCTAKMCF